MEVGAALGVTDNIGEPAKNASPHALGRKGMTTVSVALSGSGRAFACRSAYFDVEAVCEE